MNKPRSMWNNQSNRDITGANISRLHSEIKNELDRADYHNSFERPALFLALEPRIMFDGAAASEIADASINGGILGNTPQKMTDTNDQFNEVNSNSQSSGDANSIKESELLVVTPAAEIRNLSSLLLDEVDSSNPIYVSNGQINDVTILDVTNALTELVLVDDPGIQSSNSISEDFSKLGDTLSTALNSESNNESPHQLVIIDASIEDPDILLKDIILNASNNEVAVDADIAEILLQQNIEVRFLDNATDGVEQLEQILDQYNQELDSLHIISHGSDGEIQLGNASLNSNNIDSYYTVLQQWSGAFNSDADILIYGCNVAQTQTGQAFIAQLAELTQTDIGASTDNTGSTNSNEINSNWDLEYSNGQLETEILFSSSNANDYKYILAVNDPGLTSFFTLTDSTVTEDDGNALTLTLTPGAAFTSGGDFAGRVGYDFAFESDAVSETRFDISSFITGGGGTLATGGQITGTESVLITLKGGSEVDDHATRADDDTILGSLVINIDASNASASSYSGYLYETINPTAPDSKFSFGAVTVGSAASTSSIISGTADPARRDVTISIDSATDEIVVDLNGIASTPTRVSYMAEYFDASTASRDLVETVSGSNGVQNFAINAGGSSSINVDIDNAGNLADEVVVVFEMGRTVLEAASEPSASGRIVVTDTGGGNYIANGIITSSDGFTGQDNGVTYTFENYSLASGNFIIASGATLAGTDTTGFTGNNATTGLVGNEIDFRLSISGSNLVIEQSSGVTAAMDSLYVVQTFENNVNPSAAIDLGTTVANATNAPDDATNDFQVNNVVGGTADIYIPIATGAKTGTLTFGSQAPTGNATGENHWVASVNIDLENSTTSGYSVGRRSSTTDLVSWSNVALGTSTSGGSSGTVELVTYSGTKTVATIASGVTTNHSVGQNFNDPQVGGLTFSVYSDSSGNEFIRVQAYRAVTGSGEYILEGAAVQWQGQETIRMEDVPDGMVLSGVTFTEETQMDGTRDIIMTADDILAGTPVLTYQVGGDNYNGSFVQNFQLTGDASLTSTATFTTTAAVDNVTLTDIAYNDFTSSGNTVAEILNTTDQDPQTKLPTPGYVNNIAITGLNNDPTTGGKWQYSLDGATWFDVGTVSTTQALLLNNDDKLRYVPGVTTPSNDETADISFLAWDGTGSTDAGATAMSAGNKIDTTQAITDGEQSVLSATSDTGVLTITGPEIVKVEFDSLIYSSLETGTTISGNLIVSGTDLTGQGAQSVDIILIDNTATAGSDYTAGPITVNIAEADYSTAQSIGFSITISDDTLLEGDETINLSLSNFSALAVSGDANGDTTNRSTATATIEDNEFDRLQGGNIVSRVTASDATGLELSDDGAFTVSLYDTIAGATVTNSTGSTIAVNATITGSATGGGTDYTIAAFDIADGASSGVVAVTVVDDTFLESDETVIATLGTTTVLGENLNADSAPNNAATITIEDNELDRLQAGTLVTRITASDATGLEGTDDAAFTVSLYDTVAGGAVTNTTGSTITVNTTITGSATGAGTDYTLASFDIADGATSGVVAVTVADDTFLESDETVIATLGTTTVLGSSLNADVSPNNAATVTIEDDELDDLQAGNIVTRITASDATGLEGTDDAAFTVSLHDSGGALITNSTGFSITVNTTITGSATGAGTDYTLAAFDIADGASSGVVGVTVVDDTFLESDETVIATLGTTTVLGASLNADVSPNNAATVTIEDDELDDLQAGNIVTRITASDATGLEGTDDGAFTVSLHDSGGALITNSTGSTITVNTTITGSATGAGTDYTLASFDIADGATSGVVGVTVVDDTVLEGDETVIATLGTTTVLGSSLNADVSPNNAATVTIEDDELDDLQAGNIVTRITASDATGLEGTDDAAFTVSLHDSGGALITNSTGSTITVNTTITGSATGAGTDYTLATFDIADGASSGLVGVTVVDDTELEGDETVTATLGTTTVLGASLNADSTPNNAATVTIEDDELDDLQAGNIVTRITASDATGLEGTDDAAFTVSLHDSGGALITNSTGSAITVNTTITGSATGAGTDYTLAAFDIADGANSGVVGVTVVDDTELEGDETVIATLGTTTVLGSSLNADVSPNNAATVTIEDDELDDLQAGNIVTRITASDATGLELSHDAAFTVSLHDSGGALITNSTGSAITVNTTITGSATGAGTDYTLAAFDIADGASSGVVGVTVVDDTELEGDETVIATLGTTTVLGENLNADSAPNNAAAITIEDNELDRLQAGNIVSRITASDPTGTEGSDNAAFTVSLYDTVAGTSVTNSTGSTITVSHTELGTSTATGSGTDYTIASFDIIDGATSGVVIVTVIDDLQPEATEILDIQINDTSGILGTILTAEIGQDTASISIIDNEPNIEWELAGTTSLVEGANGSYTLSLGGAIIGNAVAESVDIILSNISTIAPDYDSFTTAVDTAITAYSGNGTYSRIGNTITFTGDGNAAGDLAIALGTVDDALIEGDESYIIALSNVVSGTGATLHTNNSVTTTLEDQELDRLQAGNIVSRITASDATGLEGTDDGAFTVSLYDTVAGAAVSNSTGSTITVATTITGSATGAGTDYTLASFDIADGATSGVVGVTVVDDTELEADETVIATLGTTTVLGASLNADVSPNNAATVTIEDDELDDLQAGNIVTRITASDATGLEGTDDAAFTVSLHDSGGALITNTTGSTITVNATITGSATGGGTDYTIAAFDIADGASSGVVAVTVADDTFLESDETVIATLGTTTVLGSSLNADSTPNNAATITIEDNEFDRLQAGTLVTRITASDATGLELSDDAAFTVSLYDTVAGGVVTNTTGSTITVATTITGSATGGGTDYTLAAFDIADGATSGVVAVTVADDTFLESDETVIATLGTTTVLGSSLNADVSPNNAATVTIEDNELDRLQAGNIVSRITASDATGLEGTDDGAFTVSLYDTVAGAAVSNSTGSTITVATTITGSATGAGTDYTLASFDIADGATSGVVGVTVVDDTELEADETVIATLGTTTVLGASLNADVSPNNAATVTIEDDELDDLQAGNIVTRITASDATGLEGTDDAAFTVSLHDSGGALITNTTGSTITVNATITGSATGGGTDYTIASFDIADGASSGVVAVTVADDTFLESDETVIATLGTTTVLGASLNADSTPNNAATITIEDNEFDRLQAGTLVTRITASDATGLELSDDAAFTVSLYDTVAGGVVTNTTGSTITVATTITGSATGGGTDYTIAAFDIADGATSGVVAVTVADDTFLESDETVIATLGTTTVLGSSLNADVSPNNAATVTIEDNELDRLQAGNIVSRITASDATGLEGTDDGAFTVSLYDTVAGAAVSNSTGSTITVATTITGSATGAGTDYTLASFDIADGATSGVVGVTVVDDTELEADETVIATLGTTTVLGASLNADVSPNNAATVTIEDDELDDLQAGNIVTRITASDATGLEGTDDAAFTVSLHDSGGALITNTTGSTITVNATITGSATGGGTDYTIASFDIADGASSGVVAVTVADDTFLESDETVIATLGTTTVLGASLNADSTPNNAATITIEDNEFDRLQAGTLVTRITASDATGLELSDDAAFTVSLYDTVAGGVVTNTTGSTITVATTITGSATGGGTDYTIAAFDIADGATSGVVAVTVADDTFLESDETVIATLGTTTVLGSSLNADVSPNNAATVTIEDNELDRLQAGNIVSRITASDATGLEGTDDGAFTVSLYDTVAGAAVSNSTGSTITVATTITGSATGAGTDYTLASFDIADGATSGVVGVTVVDDTELEADETVIATLGTTTVLGASLNADVSPNNAATVTIEDDELDDLQAGNIVTRITASDATGLEGTDDAAFTVSLHDSGGALITNTTGSTITVNATITGSATGGGTDYTIASFDIADGASSGVVAVTVADDTFLESDETVIATLGTTTVLGASLNADSTPNNAATITIEDNEFDRLQAGTLVTRITASDATGLELSDDAAFTVSLYDTVAGGVVTNTTGSTITVATTITGSATGGGTDYTIAAFDIADGATSGVVAVTVADDTFLESDETVIATLGTTTVLGSSLNADVSPNNAATVTIEDNELDRLQAGNIVSRITASDATGLEGTDDGAFTVSLYDTVAGAAVSNSTGSTITVATTITGSATGAGTDYTLASFDIADGATSGVVGVTVVDDTELEADETVIATLGTTTVLGASLNADVSPNNAATVTIEDDELDDLQAGNIVTRITASDATGLEGTDDAAFTVSLHDSGGALITNTTGSTITVNATITGSATGGGTDYTIAAFDIADGASSGVVAVTVADDTFLESDETVIATLGTTTVLGSSLNADSTPNNAATITIEDNEFDRLQAGTLVTRITASDATGLELSDDAAFTVSLYDTVAGGVVTNTTGSTITVATTITGSATGGGTDYTLAAFDIADGATSGVVAVTVADDTFLESDETVIATLGTTTVLGSSLNADVSPNNAATVTIEDNELDRLQAGNIVSRITASDATGLEGTDDGAFTVSLYDTVAGAAVSNSTGSTITVATTITGSATGAGTDYTLASFDIADGATSGVVGVTVVDDTELEADETVIATLGTTTVLGASLNADVSPNNAATVTIEDDELDDLQAGNIVTRITASDATGLEGTDDAAFTVSLHDSGGALITNTTGSTITVNATITGSATGGGTDYTIAAFDIADGASSGVVAVTVADDTFLESDETVIATLGTTTVLGSSLNADSTPNNAATITIEDNEFDRLQAGTLVTRITASDATGLELSDDAAFTVSLYDTVAGGVVTNTTGSTITVATTITGSATGGGTDYTLASFDIADGATSGVVGVTVVDDTELEADETVIATLGTTTVLGSSLNADVSPNNAATVTIEDNELDRLQAGNIVSRITASDATGLEGTDDGAFTVSLYDTVAGAAVSNSTGSTITVATTITGSATGAGTDYTLASFDIADGATSGVVGVTVVDDTELEADETVIATLGTTTVLGASLNADVSPNNAATVTIEDDELDDLQAGNIVTRITASDATGLEGTDDAAFTVSLHDSGGALITNTTGSTITVNATITGSATGGGTDYTIAAFDIADGASSGVVAVTVADDTFLESDETVIATLGTTTVLGSSLNADSTPNNAATITIEDNEFDRLQAGTLVTRITASDATGLELSDDAAFTVSLYDTVAGGVVTNTTGSTITVATTITGSATGGGTDYTLAAFDIADGATSGVVAVTVADDTFLESDETVIATLGTTTVLGSSLNADVSPNNAATVTIEDNELDRLQAGNIVSRITASDATGLEGTDDGAFTVSLYDTVAGAAVSNSTGSTITVATTITGSATGAGTDYTLASFDIADGATSGVVGVTVVDDTELEADETVIATLGTTTVLGASLNADVSPNNAATVTIEDDELDDLQAGNIVTRITASDATGLEGTDDAAFTVSLHDSGGALITNTTGSTITVNATITGSATGGGTDYTIASFDIADGASSGVVAVTVADDTFLESDETVIATLGTTTVLGASLNADSTPNNAATITIEDNEFDRLQAGTLVTRITASDATGLELSDDAAFTVSLYDTVAGGVVTNTTGSTITVATTITGSATGGGTDYTLAAFDIADGATSGVVAVTVADDTFLESDETVIATLGTTTVLGSSLNADVSPNNAATVTIEDNELDRLQAGNIVSRITASDATGLEGTDDGAFTVSLYDTVAGAAVSNSTGSTITVATTITGSATGAGTDYTLASFDIADGATSGVVGVTVVDDTELEADETVIATLGTTTVLGASLNADVSPNNAATVTIEDDELDDLQAGNIVTRITASDATGLEGTDDAAFTVSLHDSGGALITNTTGSTITVNATITGSATGGGTDYTIAAFDIADGASSGVVAVTVADDTFLESDETVIATLGTTTVLGSSLNADSTPNNAATITIEDNEFDRLQAGTLVTRITASDATGLELSDDAAFTVSLYDTVAGGVVTNTTGSTITVATTITGSATGGGTDYTLAAFDIADGATSGVVAVTVADDTFLESDETVIATLGTTTVLGSSLNADVSPNNAATVTIEDNELDRLQAGNIVSRITASDATGLEGTDDGAFTVSLYDTVAGAAVSNSTGSTITVATTITGSATGAGTDYTLASFDIADGATSGVVGVTVVDDTELEADETVIATLGTTTVLGASLNADVSPNNAATVTIEDDELDDLQAGNIVTRITASDATGLEGTDDAAFTVSLHDSGGALITNTTGSTITVNATITGSATGGGTDYTIAAFDIADGASSGVVAVTVADDTFLESDETVIATLGTTTVLGSSLNADSTPNNAATITIEDNEFDRLQAGTLVTRITASDATGLELSDDAAFTVSLYDTVAGGVVTNTTGSTITVATTITGSATGGGTDYTLASFDIADGATSGVVGVTVVDDTELEADETVIATLGTTTVLGSSLNADVSPNNAATVTIEDNELDRLQAGNIVSRITASDATGLEGTDDGAFTVSLYDTVAGAAVSNSTGSTITVATTITGSATGAGTDYTLASFDIADGATSGVVGVTVVDDTELEADETVIATLGTTTVLGASLNADVSPNNAATVTIEDDELDDLQAGNIVTRITASDATGLEGTDDAAFTVSLHDSGGALITNTTGSTITVNATITGSATGGGTDYTIAAFDIADGASSGVVAVTVADDTFLESDETVIATLGTTTVLGSSLNADSTPNNAATITIEDNEFDRLQAGTLVTRITASDATGLELSDDAAFTVSLYDTVAGGVVTNTTGSTITVATTITGSATGGGTDYTLAAFDIADGATSGVVAVTVADDTFLESDETVIATLGTTTVLGSSLNADVSPNNAATVTIEDNELDRLQAGNIVSRITASDATGLEGTDDGAFTVSLYDTVAGAAVSNSTGSTITVATTITGSATGAGTDYTLASFDIADGATSGVVGVTVVDDTELEADETVIATLGTTTVLGASLNADVSPNNAATVTIEDDELDDLQAGNIVTRITASDATVTESGNGEFLVSLYNTSAGNTVENSTGTTITVNATISGTATSGTDYTIAAFDIADGASSGMVAVNIIDDTVLETNETITATLSTITILGANVNPDSSPNDSATITIVDNEEGGSNLFSLDSSNSNQSDSNSSNSNDSGTNYFIIGNPDNLSLTNSLVDNRNLSRVIAFEQSRGGIDGENSLYDSVGRPMEGTYIADVVNNQYNRIDNSYGAGDRNEIIRFQPFSNEVNRSNTGNTDFNSIDDLMGKLKKKGLLEQSADILDTLENRLNDFGQTQHNNLAILDNFSDNLEYFDAQEDSLKAQSNALSSGISEQLQASDRFETILGKLKKLV